MARKRYTNDYRLTERIDQNGRVRRDVEYVGEPYHYRLEPAALRHERRSALLACAVGAMAFIAALVPFSAAAHTVYAVLPFAFAALPLGIAAETLLSAPKEGPLERRQADRLANRYPAASVFIVILSAAALAGEGIFALLGGALFRGDAVFSVCAALLAACGVFLLNKRRSFDTRND